MIQTPTKKNGTKAKFKGPLMDMISMEGIGLGSKMKDVKEAYPDVKKLPVGTGYEVKGRGKTAMDFVGYGSNASAR